MGMKYELVRRPSTSSFVIPSSENLKWRAGSSKGELMIGFSMTTWLMESHSTLSLLLTRRECKAYSSYVRPKGERIAMATSTTLGPIALPQPKRTATGAAFKRFVQMKKKFGMFSGSECSQITRLLPASEHLVQGLIPPCSVNIMVGDSGIGKSPMAYQLGLSIAAGMPFLGMRTRPGKVALIDYENNLADVDSLLKQQTKHLGLTAVPNQFLLWPLTRDPLQDHVEEVIHIFAPDLVVIDSLRTFSPEMESNSRRAVDKIKHLRVTASEHGTAF